MYIKVDGVNDVIHAMDLLPDHLNTAIRKEVIGQAGEYVADAARRVSPIRTGKFRKSIGVVVRYYRESDTVLAIVGARRGSQFEDRANIAHLLEFGWRIAVGGTLKRKSGKSTPASRRTGKRGEGTHTGNHPGFLVMTIAANIAGDQAVGYIKNVMPIAINKAVAEVRRA